jgi:transposase
VQQAIAYYRVSTARQGRSGLGIQAQRETVTRFAAIEGFDLVAEFAEIETGKGADGCLSLDSKSAIAYVIPQSQVGITPMTKYTFKQFQAEYPDDASCLAELMLVNYGGTEITCPACGVDKAKFYPMTKRRAFACQECGHHIYPAAGTIFHKSRTNLTKWFFAMYLMTSTRHGVAAKEVERQLGVTYKCAWRMCHELRKLMASADSGTPLSGHVEIDETIVGGYQKRADRRAKGSNKTVIFGMVERDGRIVAGPVPDITKSTLEPIVLEHISTGSTISTDELRSYEDLKRAGYTHGAVNHKREEWRRDDFYTNTIEGHWSLFKRAVRGTHVSISTKHMWKYVSEFSYRRNMRHSHQDMFNRLVGAFALPRLQDA